MGTRTHRMMADYNPLEPGGYGRPADHEFGWKLPVEQPYAGINQQG